MAQIKVKDALLRQFQADGIDVIFGNPGSTEENFLQAAGENPGMRYVLGLQEASVAAMADGWARTSHKTAVCQIHSAVGLGNAMGVLYEAFRSHTPIIFLAGEPPQELQAFDGFLAGDLAALARPLTKWSARLTHGTQALRIVRRALKVAATPPYGPVFLALPMDVLDEETDDGDIFPSCSVVPPSACTVSEAAEIARSLADAEMPMLLAGDGITEAGGRNELEELAHMLAAPVWGVECNEPILSFRDSLFMGLIGHSFGDHTRTITSEADVLLAMGTPVFPELFPSVQPYFRSGARLYQIDRDPWEIAKNFPVQKGLQSDPKGSMILIIEELRKLLPDIAGKISARREKITEEKKAAFAHEEQTLESVPDTPDAMSPATLMHTLATSLPENALVYDESLTSTSALLHYLRPENSDSYVLARGGCIGVGWPGAVGAAVSRSDCIVIAPSGDGSALFALQTLWTAVHENLKIIFIVCNNAAYRILKINLLHYLKSAGDKLCPFPYMDISSPRINFAVLAEGVGMKSCRVKNGSELRKAVREAAVESGPYLIDALVNGSVETDIDNLFPA